MPGDMTFSTSIEEFQERIRTWYDQNHDNFASLYHDAIKHVVPCPEKKSSEVYYDWQGADIQRLCDFFGEWYDWKSGVKNGLDYIEKFSWINYLNDAGMAFVTSGPGYAMTADFTHLQGKQMDDPHSKELIETWVRELGSKRMDDYKVRDWKNFNEFFVREIKEDRRPIAAKDDDTVVVAPADCVINMIVDELGPYTGIPVKTVSMNVGKLLDGSEYAKKFIGGTAVSCILMPDSYHWYHAPVAGEVVAARDDIGGCYYGMRDFPGLLDKGNVGYGYDYSMFDDFRRGYVIIRTQYQDAYGGPDGEGYVGLVPVGLNSIASVNFLEKFKKMRTKPIPVEKGERIGNFAYGGSLNILLFERGRFPALQLLQGQRIGVLEPRERTEKLFTDAFRTRSRRVRPFSP
ncbi:phosphatidylserine decarboxylase [Streptomyces sp. NPDC021100]|uniref:phosphatidylserine decarboxylase n=1 Tax=Streptomyces sp. NPDC021100 TaxID=3365114 RepID=UPI00379EA1E3